MLGIVIVTALVAVLILNPSKKTVVVQDTTYKYFGNEVEADLNSDGKVDKVMLVTENSIGTGVFYYVVVNLKTEDGYTETNKIFLGDRIAPQTTEVHDSEIVVNYADRKASEPMTNIPSVGVSRYFKVINGVLEEIKK